MPKEPLKQNKIARGNTRDINQDMEGRAGRTRSVYRSRRYIPTDDDGRLFGRYKVDHARAIHRKRNPPEVLHSVAQHTLVEKGPVVLVRKGLLTRFLNRD